MDRVLIDHVLAACDPRLRLAHAGDGLVVGALFRRLAAAEWTHAPVALEANVARFLAQDGLVVLVEHAGLPAGFAALMVAPAPAEGTVQLFLDDLFVVPEARRLGLGRALVRGALSVGRALQAACVYLHVRPDNLAARALYASCGMEAVADVVYEYYPPRRRVAGAMTDHGARAERRPSG